jgi:membrane-associated protein
MGRVTAHSLVTSAGPGFLDPQRLISAFGLLGILVAVFAESGILAGFFLPGDSLLFTAGLLVAGGTLHVSLWLVCLLISVAAIAGDQVGYLLGRRVGPALFRRPDSRLFKQRHLRRAESFFADHGARSVVLARFVPVVRTFTPVLAGASRMNYRTFLTYNVIGGIAWGTGVTVAGYFLGQIGFVRSNVEFILIAIVAVSFIPVVVEFIRSRRRHRRAAEQSERQDVALRS